MSFTNNNTNEVSVALTNYGKKVLATTGLQGLQLYCEFTDSDVNYVVDVYPSLGVDFKGNTNGGILGIPINNRYILT